MEDFKYTKKINKIKSLLGLEIKLEQIALDNGIVFEAEVFEPGQPVFVLAEGERMPVPVGEFELPDGRVLVVMEEGIIAEMRSGEEAPAEEQEQEMEADPGVPAKKVVESTTKETHFSAEDLLNDFNSLKERVEALEAKLTKEIEVEASEEKVSEPEKIEVEASEEKAKDVQEVELKSKKPTPEKSTKVKFTNNFKRPSTHHEKVLKSLFS